MQGRCFAPDACFPQDLPQGCLQFGKGYAEQHGRAQHNDKIVAGLHLREIEAQCFTYPPPRPIALDGFADLLASDNPTARLPPPIGSECEPHKRMLHNAPDAPHPLKLSRTA